MKLNLFLQNCEIIEVFPVFFEPKKIIVFVCFEVFEIFVKMRPPVYVLVKGRIVIVIVKRIMGLMKYHRIAPYGKILLILYNNTRAFVNRLL